MSDLRPELRKTYLYVVNNFAVTTPEVAKALFDGDTKAAGAALRLLAPSGLVEGMHVNGEKPLTWQSHYDIENSDPKETLKSARADFKRAFPKPVGPSVATERKGATGPRYTAQQIVKGLKARKAGKTNKQVAEAAGVKSPAYFSKVLKAAEAEGVKPEVAAKLSGPKGVKTVASKPRRTVRRSTKSAA